MAINPDIKKALERELRICSDAARFYKRALTAFEAKYKMSTSTFLKKFEEGSLGDEQVFFDWYAYAQLLTEWKKTKASLLSAIK